MSEQQNESDRIAKILFYITTVSAIAYAAAVLGFIY